MEVSEIPQSALSRLNI